MIPTMRYVLLCTLILAGCAPSIEQVVTPDGRQAYAFHCGGLFDSKVDCNFKASQICPKGYYPLDSSPGYLLAVCAIPGTPRPAGVRPAI